MTFDSYQAQAQELAIYPAKGTFLGVMYTAMGLAEEAGEFVGKVKKAHRDSGSKITPEARELMLKELGDTLWYLQAAAKELGTTLSEVASGNLRKLQDRKRRGTLGGSGDSR